MHMESGMGGPLRDEDEAEKRPLDSEWNAACAQHGTTAIWVKTGMSSRSYVAIQGAQNGATPDILPASTWPVLFSSNSLLCQVPDMNKRNIMNLILAAGVGLPIGAMTVPFALFFVPKG